MEDIQCIFCNRESTQVIIEENGYKGRKCPTCGLIFISPRPTFSEISKLYSSKHISTESLISSASGRRLYARHSLAIIKRYIQSGSLLEIGAGAGYFVDEAKKAGFEPYGIELNHDKANFIINTLAIPCEETPLDESSFRAKKFDLIYHCDVISHFYDPIAEFRKINDKLKDNGILVFETGSGDINEKYYKVITKWGYPEHLFVFSQNGLEKLLELTGFEFIRIYRYSILVELLIRKRLTGVIDFIKSQEKISNVGKNSMTEVSSSNVSRFSFKRLIENAYYYFFNFIRYKIGYVMPKKGRPQTVIIIARKRK